MVRSCSPCGADNPDTARFCMECGQALIAACRACGASPPPGAKFCADCGQRVTEASEQSTQGEDKSDPVPSATAARRQITVLFSDLVGSTALSERLDAEDYRELIADYRRVAGQIAARYQGHVANYVGDGIDILFGYPVAREDSARAAALAALDIAREAPAIGTRFPDLDVETQVRIGLHTGAVVIGEKDGDGLGAQSGLFGDVPNIAARLQSQGRAGQVVCSNATRRLIGPRLRFDSIGHKTLHGVSEAMEVFRILGPSGVEASRFSSDATPLIGRGAELALVRNRWEAAIDGDGQILFIGGEAGIGKSRIAFAFSDELASENTQCIVFSGSSIHRNSTFHCLRATLIALIGGNPEDSVERLEEKIGERLEDLGLNQQALIDSFRDVLLSGSSDKFASEKQRSRIMASVITVLKTLARRNPLLIVMDDIHWVDPSTLEIIRAWFNEIPGQRCLFIATARPEFESSLQGLAHVSLLKLNRLGKRDTLRIVEAVAGRLPPIQIQSQIIKRTDGIPLYIEELTRMVLESGDFDELSANETVGPIRTAIPDSLQASLLARIDRIGNVRELVQIAATIGREFDPDLLASVCGLARDALEPAMQALVEAELVVQRGPISNAVYSFRHALVQDAAYQSMLRADRAKWHDRVARAILAASPQAQGPEILAYHWMQAGQFERAEDLWTNAGNAAVKRAAWMEAIAHFRQAIRCISQLPQSPERDLREMDIRIQAGVPLASVKGYAHRSVQDCYARALELGRELGEQERLFDALYGQFRANLLAADYQLALKNAHMLATLSDDLSSTLSRQRADRCLGAVLHFSGQPVEALAYLDKALATPIDPSQRQSLFQDDVVDIHVVAHSYAALSAWQLGRFPDSAQHSHKAVTQAEALGHPFTLAFALCFAAWRDAFNGDRAKTGHRARQVIDICEANGIRAWVGIGRFFSAWSDAQDQTTEARLANMDTGLDEWLSTGSRLGQSFFLALRGDVALTAGDLDEASACLVRAQEFSAQSGESFWNAGLVHLAGRIALRDGATDDAQRHFAKGTRDAQDTGARGLALLNATALTRALTDTPKQSDGVVLLREVLGSVSVAPDVSFCADAETLLQTLSATTAA